MALSCVTRAQTQSERWRNVAVPDSRADVAREPNAMTRRRKASASRLGSTSSRARASARRAEFTFSVTSGIRVAGAVQDVKRHCRLWQFGAGIGAKGRRIPGYRARLLRRRRAGEAGQGV